MTHSNARPVSFVESKYLYKSPSNCCEDTMRPAAGVGSIFKIGEENAIGLTDKYFLVDRNFCITVPCRGNSYRRSWSKKKCADIANAVLKVFDAISVINETASECNYQVYDTKE
ncbi:unnamed protein product, partial [Allacma fusca]